MAVFGAAQGTVIAADLGWRTAVKDPRVDGLWLLDGLAVQNVSTNTSCSTCD